VACEFLAHADDERAKKSPIDVVVRRASHRLEEHLLAVSNRFQGILAARTEEIITERVEDFTKLWIVGSHADSPERNLRGIVRKKCGKLCNNGLTVASSSFSTSA
jgi:hypothetical protein